MSEKIKLTVNWMLDETVAETRSNDWEKVISDERSLIDAIGRNGFEHKVIDPRDCLGNLSSELVERDFTTVIDLTGWLSPTVERLQPGVPIINDFGLSRVRNVTSPRLETIGHRLSLGTVEIKALRESFDWSNTLIIDDVGFSGGTNITTMEILGMKPENTTHVFLIGNDGNLGEIPGAVNLLTQAGSEVLSGHLISTPEDDGWHLKDLHAHEELAKAFRNACILQDILLNHGPNSHQLHDFLVDENKMNALFPNRLEVQDIKDLVGSGHFLLQGELPEKGEFASNPFLWASQYLGEHVDMEFVVENPEKILEILQQIKLSASGVFRQEAMSKLAEIVSI
jgi:hypothetical protein